VTAAPKKLPVKVVRIDSLTEDPENARTHSEENLRVIANSLDKFGQRKPIVTTHDGIILAGNGTMVAARDILGWTHLSVAPCPEEWTYEEARAYALTDNQSALLADWDAEKLSGQLVDLDAVGWDLEELGFASLNPMVADDGHSYTEAVNVPQYEVRGETFAPGDLYDTSHAAMLRKEILAADLTPEVADFLLNAANRHVRFNYRRIAEFYAAADPVVQKFMEDSALVIIDVEDAIRLGYAKFDMAVEKMRDENPAT